MCPNHNVTEKAEQIGDDLIDSTTDVIATPKGWGTRHTLTLLGFFGTAIACSIQNNIALAIVSMVQTIPKTETPIIFQFQDPNSLNLALKSPSKKADDSGAICPNNVNNKINEKWNSGIFDLDFDFENTNHKDTHRFQWTETDQGLILGAFYWGFIFTLYPGGRLAHRYGGKWIFSIGVVLSGVLTLILPLATVQWGKYGIICIRILQGLAQGITCPAIQVMLAQWSPINERSRLSNFVHTGYQFGTAISMISGGFLIEFLDWPSLFYTVGSISIFWFGFWSLFVFSSPSEHPRISAEELHYIQASTKRTTAIHNSSGTPWKAMLLSLPFWAVFILQVGQFWAKNTIQVEMPKYLGAVHGLQIRHIGWISALPQFLNCIFGMLTSYLSDLLIVKNITSIQFTRKLCAAIVGFGTSSALIGIGLGGCNTVVALACLFAGGIVSGANRGSWTVNIIDIAPNHAGTMMAVGGVVSYFLGMVAPYATGVLLHRDPSLTGWQLVFAIGALTNLLVSLFYLKFASADEQPWNRSMKENNNIENNI